MASEKNSNKGIPDIHEFMDLLEKAVSRPDQGTGRLLECVRQNLETCLPLLVKIFEHPDETAKRFVAELFKGPLRELASETLLPLLKGENSEKFFWASSILAELKETRAIQFFIQGIKSPNKTVAVASLKGLSFFEGKESLEALLDFLLTSEDWLQLSAVMKYLVPRASEANPILQTKFPHLSSEKKAWVLKFLAETGDPAALPLFSRTLEEEPEKLGIFCITGLGKIGNAEAVKTLVKHLDNREWFIRKRIVEALGNTKNPEAIPFLVKSLVDISLQVRAGAIESLTKIGHLDLNPLIAALESGSHELRVGLIKILGKIRDIRVVKPLIGTLKDRTTLFFSIDALGDLGFPEAASALEPFIKDSEWFNRLNALEALSKLHHPNIREIAEKCLDDPNDMVRNAATRIFTQTHE